MYSVKKFVKGDVISKTPTRLGELTHYATHTTWGVIDSEGKVVITTDKLGKKAKELYPRKSTALEVAAYYNCLRGN